VTDFSGKVERAPLDDLPEFLPETTDDELPWGNPELDRAVFAGT